MIVVTAPTGNIGHHVVENLLAAGETVRVIARDPARLKPKVRDRVEAVAGSHADGSVLDQALAGADAVFWLVPPDPKSTLDEAYLDFSRAAAEAFRRHQVGHVVGVTALGRGTPWEDRAGLVTASIRMDDLIMSSGVAYRGMAMPSFMDNVLMQLATIEDQGLMVGPSDPDRKAPTTATRDMGMVAAKLLRDRSWSGQEDVPVLGPEDLSMSDMAATVSDVIGREVRYRRVPYDAFKSRLLERGVSESFAQGYVDMFRAKDEGMDNRATRSRDVVCPTSFRQWCEEELKPALAR